MKNKLIIYTIALLFVIPQTSSAITLPIGGRVVMVQECFCNGGWMMYIWDQYTKGIIPVIFQFGFSGLKSNYNIWMPGVQTLGTYTATGAVCLPATTLCEVPIPAAGYITPGIGTTGIGTSLLPG